LDPNDPLFERHSVFVAEFLRNAQATGYWTPQPASDLTGDDAVTAPYQLSHLAISALGTAAETLHTGREMIAERHQVGYSHTPFTLLRSAIEASATAIWLLTPTERKTRATRALRLNFADIVDGARAAKTFDLALPTPAAAQHHHLLAVGKRAGIPPAAIKKWVKTTDIVRAADAAIGDRHTRVYGGWQVCSGLAHGKRWPQLMFLDRTILNSDPDTGVATITFTADFPRYMWVLNIAVVLSQHARDLYLHRARPVSTSATQ